MRAVIVSLLGLTLLLPDAAAARAPRIDDPVLRDVERAFDILRTDRPAAANRARGLLAGAGAALDDLTDDRETIARVVGGDDSAPWRGLPHERVFILLTLAALDVDAGRCDLALPTLKNALHHRDRGRLQHGLAASTVSGDDDVTLALVLRARCAVVDGLGDVDAARAALRARPDGEALLTAAVAPALVLEFAGRAPEIVAVGAHGEQGQLVWRDDAAHAFAITIGRPAKSSAKTAAATSSLLVHDLQTHAQPPGPAATARRATQAAKKSQLTSQASQYASRGQAAASGASGVRGVVGAGLLYGAAAGLTVTTSVVDARVDTRTAPSMPRRVMVRRAG